MRSLLALLAVLTVSLLCVFPANTAHAGEWLGGQYWGQISGCGHCGGSLYGVGYCPTPYPWDGCPCDGAGGLLDAQPAVPVGPRNLFPGEAEEVEADAFEPIEDVLPPGSSVIPTSHMREIEGPSARRDSARRDASRRTYDSILPIAPAPSAGDVKTITHASEPERLMPPQHRIVAPNAWSGRLYR